jgi:hypothetical protein
MKEFKHCKTKIHGNADENFTRLQSIYPEAAKPA